MYRTSKQEAKKYGPVIVSDLKLVTYIDFICSFGSAIILNELLW